MHAHGPYYFHADIYYYILLLCHVLSHCIFIYAFSSKNLSSSGYLQLKGVLKVIIQINIILVSWVTNYNLVIMNGSRLALVMTSWYLFLYIRCT